tara:strand:+ start:80 stop:505 length:426 start_codon:yes stop_codon:yes gene_type:complete
MKTKKQKREAAISYMKDAKYYSITAVAKRFNIPYNTVWTYDKNLKMGKYSSFKTIDRALRLVRTNVSDGSSADYYVLPEGANELQDLISHKNMNAQIGEIFRSCYRYGQPLHSDMLRDAKKIKFYAEAEIKRLEKLNEGKN